MARGEADRIRGTLAAAVTPLRDHGDRLDTAAFEPLFEFYATSGLDGVLVLGTTGEGIMLGPEERRQAADLAIANAGPLAVIVNCGAQTTRDTRLLAAHAATAGADAVAAIGPPYLPFAPVELVEHFASAAEACAPLPFYIYEYSDRTGYALPVSVVEEVRGRAPNLVGMKVSDAPYECVEPYLALGLDIFIGAEALIAEGLENGAVGAVSGVAAAFPEAVCELVRDPTAQRSQLVEALRAALSERPFQAAVKAALGLRGIPVGPDVRAPLQPLRSEDLVSLRRDLSPLVSDVLARQLS